MYISYQTKQTSHKEQYRSTCEIIDQSSCYCNGHQNLPFNDRESSKENAIAKTCFHLPRETPAPKMDIQTFLISKLVSFFEPHFKGLSPWLTAILSILELLVRKSVQDHLSQLLAGRGCLENQPDWWETRVERPALRFSLAQP